MKTPNIRTAAVCLLLILIMTGTLVSCNSETPAAPEITVSETPEEIPDAEPVATTPPPTEEPTTPVPEPVETTTIPVEVPAPPTPVTVTDRGNYYEVVLDYTTGLSPRELMSEYGQILSDMAPDIRADIDGFLYDLIDREMEMYLEDLDIPSAFQSLAFGIIGPLFMERVQDIKPQIPASYAEELEGLASVLVDTETDSIGDGMLSINEFYFYHLMGDVARTVQCSAIGVSGARSETGGTMVGRNFDLEAGLEGYGAVTRIIQGDRSVYIIGWLGNVSAFTAFNDDGVFGSIVDTTGAGQPYSSTGLHAYAFDLRYALENETGFEGAADYLSRYPYGFNHLVFLADADKAGVLENNLSGTGSDMRREVRYPGSELNPGIAWDYPDIITAVSAFMLKGNHDNFTDAIVAMSRLASYRTLLDDALADGTVTWDEIKTIQSYDGMDGVPSEMEEGDIYNVGTRRIVLFQPETLRLEIFFSLTDIPANDPAPFDVIPVSFE